mgnify:CR=1 FL=1
MGSEDSELTVAMTTPLVAVVDSPSAGALQQAPMIARQVQDATAADWTAETKGGVRVCARGVAEHCGAFVKLSRAILGLWFSLQSRCATCSSTTPDRLVTACHAGLPFARWRGVCSIACELCECMDLASTLLCAPRPRHHRRPRRGGGSGTRRPRLARGHGGDGRGVVEARPPVQEGPKKAIVSRRGSVSADVQSCCFGQVKCGAAPVEEYHSNTRA